jgi:aromatic-L-amino-acid/L-tryptophan decarboxylase
MHNVDPTTESMIRSVLAYAENRLRLNPVPLDEGSRDPAELDAALNGPLGAEPHNPDQILGVYTSVVAPAVISADSPRFLGFIPAAPTKASLLFDMLVSCASIQGISWLEAAGAIHAENVVLRLIADRAGLPPTAGGCFVSGGSAANLSALLVAREAAKRRAGAVGAGRRWRVAVGEDAHSSIINTLRILEMDPLVVRTGDHRVTGAALRAAIDADGHPGSLAAAVATSGTTNVGIIDDLAGVAAVAREHGLWFHVDGAYGGPACSRPASGTGTTASSTPTRSSWTRTSGCSRRSTVRRCCTATRHWPGRCTGRTPPTSMSSTTHPASGTRPTMPTT